MTNVRKADILRPGRFWTIFLCMTNRFGVPLPGAAQTSANGQTWITSLVNWITY
jgi:hypothetical protein